MMQGLAKFAKEPLLQFLVVGAFMFLVFDLVAIDPPPDEVVITEADINAMKLLWQSQWRRPPTDAELRHIISLRVREEIYYREAIARGLNTGDGVVRRRLALKLENQIHDDALFDEPAPDVLQQYYLANITQYLKPASITFEHRFFASDLRGDTARTDAATAVDRLNQAHPVAADQFTVPPKTMASMSQLSATFGNTFADRLLALAEIGSTDWQGPVASGFGQHAVKIEQYQPTTPSTLREVEDQVRAAWRRQRMEQVQADAYAQMKQRYRVAVAR
jgi:peptidyl-prolyl cis-trans isomerase C